MLETQRQPVPRADAGELDTARAFLRFARDSVMKKTDGLSEEQLRRVLVESGTNLLGLVQHLAGAERYWFGYQLAGDESAQSADLSMDVAADRTAVEVIADYRAAIAASDAILDGVADPEQPMHHPVDGRHLSVRWVLAHMTSETARHAGHADILREQTDGITGR